MKKLITLLLLTTTLLSTTPAATIFVTNTNDSGAGSLREAITNAAMGDIIRFNTNLISSGSATITLLSPININKGIFIKGLYNSTDTLFLSGGNTTNIFEVSFTSSMPLLNVDLDSLVFINGNATLGGAINYTNQRSEIAYLYIRNCMFRNNTATNGGAIGTSRISPAGSSIFVYTFNLKIFGSTFKSNVATNSGGAIYSYLRSGDINKPENNFEITNSNFLSNTSSSRGGAIYAYAESQGSHPGLNLFEINTSTFNNNQTVTEGGAIYLNSKDLHANYVSKSIIECNTSTITNNSSIGSGGAFFVDCPNTAYINFINSTVAYNTSLVDGSAAYVYSSGTLNTYDNIAEIEVMSSLFFANNGNSNYTNTFYINGGNHVRYDINGYNIYDFAQSHLSTFTILGMANLPLEVFGSTVSAINLGPLLLNSQGTYTMIPNLGSNTINQGGPSWNTSDAQNGPILGVRDVGAAESAFCSPITTNITQSFCAGSTYNFYGQTLNSPGSYSHAVVTPNFCDTIVNLTLTQQTPATPSVSIAANTGSTIMTGTNVTFTATPLNGGSSPSYQWFINGTPTGPNAPNVSSNSLTNNAIVSCTMTSNFGCVTSPTATSNQIQFTVHSNNDESCNAISLGVNATCVTEYFANHIATNSTNVGPHTCASTTSKDIWFSFTVPASGNAYIYTYAGTLLDAVMSVYQGNNCSSLFAVGCVDDDGSNQMPQGYISGGTPGSTIYIRISSYGVVNSGSFGICVVEDNTSSINNLDAVVLNLFPNPTKDFLNITSSKTILASNIFALDGKLIMQKNNETTINLSNISTGMYFLELIFDDGTIARKSFIKD